jgi:hypothetical protein
MEHDARGREILRRAQMTRFAAVSDADYAEIREMLRAAEHITL